MWTDDQLRLLIDNRKTKNDEYHLLTSNLKCNFWKGTASEINIKFGTTYSGKQCKEKFNALVRAYKVYNKIILFNYFIILNTNIIFIREC